MIVMNMRRVYNNIINALIAVLAISTTSSCVFEKQDPVRSEQNMAVEIKVSAKDMVTKAEEEELTYDEEKIYSLRVYAFLGNRQIGYLYMPKSDNKVLYPKAEGNTDQWFIDLRLPYEGEVSVTFYAIANEEAMTGLKYNDATQLAESMSISQLEDLKYTSSSTLNTVNGLPMWAKSTVAINSSKYKDEPNRVDGHEGHHVIDMDPISLDLYRSVAKIEVYAAEEGEGESKSQIKIKSVSIENVPLESHLFVTPGTLDAKDINSVSANMTLAKAAPILTPVNKVAIGTTEPNYYSPVVSGYYIAENPYGSTVWNPTPIPTNPVTKLSITYEVGSSEKTGVVYMPTIIRNNIYRVFCLIKGTGEMTLTLQVKKWTPADNQTIDFKDNVTLETGSNWVGDIEGANGKYTFKKEAAGQEATFEFTLLTPEGGTWYATLEGDIQSFGFTDVKIYDEKGNYTSQTYANTSSISGNVTGNKIAFTIKTLEKRTESSPKKQVTVKMVAVSKYGRSLSVEGSEATLNHNYL